MSYSKADFRAMREGVGLTQQDVADAMSVRVVTVKRWERPGFPEPPEDAVMWLGDMADRHETMVRDTVLQMLAVSGRTGVKTVAVTYYRSQDQYDAHGRDEGPCGFANAVARDVAAELTAKGMDVAFRYPDDGAVRTPGSRY